VGYEWQLIPITEGIAPADTELKRFIESFNNEVDRKYSTMICKFQKTLTHPDRTIETELGNVFGDAFAQIANCDVALVGSGSIRQKALGPLVTLKDFLACFPYDDSIGKFEIKGRQLKQIFCHIMRISNRQDEGECYQVSGGVRAVYDNSDQKLKSLTVNNLAVEDENKYTICLQGYHVNNCQKFLNISTEELLASGTGGTVSSSCQQAMEEYLKNHQNLVSQVEGRLAYLNIPSPTSPTKIR